MCEMFNFKEPKNLKDYTLIFPCVSVGNVPQLTVDLLIKTYNFKKTATIWHPALIASVGSDPYTALNGEVCTACELYTNENLNLAVVQLRSSVEFKLAMKFIRDLNEAIQQFNLKNIYILSSGFDYELRNIQSEKFFCLSNEHTTEVMARNNVKQLEQNFFRGKTLYKTKVMTDNIAQQAEEMEALKSIFEDRWQVDSTTGLCSIDITKQVKLYITLVPEYPSNSLPNYELLAPELIADERQHIEDEFQNLFESHGGEPLIYQMIMIVEEAVRNKEDAKHNSKNKSEGIEPVEKKSEVFSLSVNHLMITHGPIITDRKSVFQGHTCVVKSKEDVRLFMNTLLENKKIANATHNITAFRISIPNGMIQTNYLCMP
ncbi:unnamed protein product [Acanthoscelides obtectus]|uniref:Proteasome assembly chaperone 2 n=1 Tax=Acanthoscelides obtectus TaxID=200917 RepID=A0A9P0K914_ACAOB|nr:unnamed protein product [Acanthoscelides obtectus]CAK1683135.1 Protein IMPACT-A [Acanthoscelides obtectus]